MPVTARVEGGRRLDAAVRRALSASGVERVAVGFFSTARYPDGTPVAQVALQNEYGFHAPGGAPIPARPFFRQALGAVEGDVVRLVARRVDSDTMVATPQLADEVGTLVAGAVQQRIVDLREPPNAPLTVARKGSSNPLIDTGQMRLSVTWRVV